VPIHGVENPYQGVVKHADMHCMAKIGVQEVAYDSGDMSNRVESSVRIA
jgi:hypothetical protein